ncbi:MAG: tetratricopeptide repeat protein [Mycobacteriales bacterium]
MDALPSGTVTMLFSDIEGSTVLLGRLGGHFEAALSDHRRILRAAFSRWCGHEVSTEGDSFFVVFQSAGDAVHACVDGQRALTAHEWPDGVPVRVRMGIHTGEPTGYEHNYIGMDVHRAARMAATAHGGQVVLSEVTGKVVAGRLPADVGLRDLGLHRLKDLPAPERILQLVIAGLPSDFPPLKSLGAQTSLPVPPTPLVGRDEDLRRVRDRVLEGHVRLVSLTGAGGCGKTRLALAVAASLDEFFADGVFFVPLSAATDSDVMWMTIAESIGAAGEGPAPEATLRRLSSRRALLVLDNVEQIADAPVVVARLLEAAPSVTVLATSRRRLHLQAEYEQPVPPLGLPRGQPRSVGEASASGAVQLFLQHAAMVRPGFTLTPANVDDVAAICRRLDGLPLAIELAAARLKLLAPEALLRRLDRRLTLVAGDAGRPERQQNLRATISWSRDLLPADLRPVFDRFGVFAGGCDLEALIAVATSGEGADSLDDPLLPVSELVDASLVTVADGADGEPRIGMLQTIREFALEQLAGSGGLDDVGRRHAEHFLALAERAAPELRGEQQLAWLARLEVEHDNLRAALAWSLAPPEPGSAQDGRAATGLRLAGALIWFWYNHSHAAEGRQWLERAVEFAPPGVDPPILARATHGLGVLLLLLGEYVQGRRVLERSLALWRTVGDRDRVAQGLNSLGAAHRMLGDLDSARPFLQESVDIARELGDGHRLTTALTNLAVADIDRNEPQCARELLEEALRIDLALNDSWAVAVDQGNLARALLDLSELDSARDLLRSTVGDVVALGDLELLADTLERFVTLATARREPGPAARLAAAAELIREQIGMPLSVPDAAFLARTLREPRAELGRQAWDREWAQGRRLTPAEAVALAVRIP